MLRLLLTGVLLCMWTLTSTAQIDEEQLREDAAELFEGSSFAAAYPLYAQLVSLNPKDADLNFRFGACALYTGEEKSKAIKHLTFAISRGAEDPRVYYYLGRAYHLNYEFDLAKKGYSEYLEKVSSKEKDPLPAERGLAMCSQGQNLLTNIQEIVVLEKTSSETESFFRYYNLEEIGGKVLTTPDALLSKYDVKMGHQGVIHFQPNSGAVYFSSYGKDGSTGKDLYKAFVLPDGQFSTPERLPDVINTPYDDDYAFLHPDGVSFYFASKGHNSMGGYDVFKSTVDPITGDFTPVENLDFAINTPDDDIFYVVDSLHQNAYFASSRSSSQDQMHVYKVMVQGIPMQLLFIKGQFDNLISEENTIAQIEVYDELTGRPVASVSSSEQQGDYVISFPKAGLYRYKVIEEGSQLIHEGIVEVPLFDEPVALGQELQIVDENGLEKLVIINHFEDPLDEDLAALSATVLRQKAGLDVNADEDLIKEANELANPTIKIEKAHLIAGFNAEETPEILKEQLVKEANARKELSGSLQNQAAMGMETARDAYELSNNYMEEAVSSMRDKTPENTENYIEELKAYNELINKAEDQRLLANNAIAATEKLLQESAKQQSTALALEQASAKLDSSLAAEDGESIVAILTEERERRLIGENEVNFDLKEQDLSLAATLEKQIKKQGDRLANLREDEVKLTRDIEMKMEAAASTKKKKEKEQLNEELQDLQASLRLTREEITKVDQQLTDLARDEESLRTSAELYSIFQEMEASRPGGRVAPDLEALNDLAGQVQHNGEVLSMLSRSDELVVAEASEEMRATRNDIIVLPSVKAKADQFQIELLSPEEQETAYRSAVESAQETAVGGDLKANLLAKQNMKTANEQLSVLRAVKSSTPEEQAQVDEEIEKWENLLTSFKKDAANYEDVAAVQEPVTEEVALDILSELDPESRTAFDATQNALDTEMNLVNQKVAWVSDSKQKLVQRINANEAAMLASDDQAELTALKEETETFYAALDWVETRSVSAGDVQMAYENDKKEVMESDAPYEVKLEEQIRLTEEFLSLTADLKSDPAYRTEISQLDLMANQAKSKLESYESDLELTLNAGGEPETESGTIGTADSVENELQALVNTSDILAIPEEGDESEIIEALAPQYVTQKQQIEERISEEDLLEQAAELSALDQQMIKVLENQAQLRVNEMDQTEDVAVKDLLQLEIQQIQNTIEKLQTGGQDVSTTDLVAENTGEQITAEETDSTETVDSNQTETETETSEPGQTEVNSSELLTEGEVLTADELTDVSRFDGYPEELEPSVREEFTEILTPPVYSEENELTAFSAVSLVMVEMDRPDDFTEDLDLVETKNAEIEELGIEQQLAEKRSVQRKFEKKIEKAYFQKAEAEIRNSKRISASADVMYTAQDEQLEDLIMEQSEALNNNAWLKSYLNELIRESEDQASLADQIRETVAPEIDEIAQAVGMTRAAQLDLEAVERKQKAIELLQNVDELAELDTPVLAALRTGVPAKVNFEEEGSTTAEVPEDENVITYQFILPEAYISADQQSTSNVKDQWTATYEIPNDFAEAMLMQPEFEEASGLMAQVDQKESELRQAIEEHNEIIADAADLNERATVLQNAIDSTENQAEVEGLEVERDDVMEELEVLVEALEDKASQIETKAAELTNLNEDVSEALAAVNVEEVVEKVESTTPVENTDVLAENIEQPVETDPASEEVSAPETPEVESNTSSTTTGVVYNFATTNNFENYLKTYPDELEEEVFAVTETPIYTSEQPIPLNLEMPTGIVYKVQVGAFRNAISAETFGKFAPLSGEQLNNGITRYTAGLFTQYNSADEAKKVIREMGYSDAFVVAFENGERIPLYAAREKVVEPSQQSTQEQFVVEQPANSDPVNNTNTNNAEEGSAVSNPVSNAESAEATDEVPVTPVDATDWSTQSGKFFTVQIGVFSKNVSSEDLNNAEDVYSERVSGGQVRYTSGRFTNLDEARDWKSKMVALGIEDAFLSAYQNGNRISVAQALGTASDTQSVEAPAEEPEEQLFYQVVIGVFKDEVPSKTALALLNLETRWGIVQQQTPEGTMYVTKLVSSMGVVELIQNEFNSQGVKVIEAITYKNGERMGSQGL